MSPASGPLRWLRRRGRNQRRVLGEHGLEELVDPGGVAAGAGVGPTGNLVHGEVNPSEGEHEQVVGEDHPEDVGVDPLGERLVADLVGPTELQSVGASGW